MKRKFMFLPSVYSKEIVDSINEYLDKGYEIEDILNADGGYYILLILKGGETYDYKHKRNFDLSDKKNVCNLIEEKWVTTCTNDIVFNTSTGDTLPN